MVNSNISLKNREQAAEALKQLKATRWSSFKNGYFSPRGFTSTVCTVLLNTVLLQFVLPLVPGVTFTGNFAQAFESALMILAMTAVAGQFVHYTLEGAMAWAAQGQTGKSAALTFGLFFVGTPAIGALNLKVLTLVPGALALHGLLAWVLTMIVFLIAGTILATVFNLVWPAKKASKIEDSSTDKQN
jgi:hypothetical protein